MKDLSRFSQLCYYIGSFLLIIGAAIHLFEQVSYLSVSIFTVGVFCFTLAQVKQTYEGNNFIICRLRRQQLLGAAFLVITALLLILQLFNLLPIYKNPWKILFFIGCILQIYTAFRIPSEWEKEKRKEPKDKATRK